MLAELHDLNDVGVRHRSRDARLRQEHLYKAWILRAIGQDPLYNDLLLKPCGTSLLREKDLSHAALRDLLDEVVLAKPSGHVVWLATAGGSVRLRLSRSQTMQRLDRNVTLAVRGPIETTQPEL
jgi:hypothetical protein